MAGTATLNRSEWKNALDQLTADQDGKYVTIELLDPVVGNQHEVERLPFSYINYDPKDDVVIVAVGGKSPRHLVVLRHMVWHPTEADIAVEEVFGTGGANRRTGRHDHPGALLFRANGVIWRTRRSRAAG